MTDATYIIIGNIKYSTGDRVWYGYNRGKVDEVTFTEGFVCFGEFSAEIYTCYGFYVGDNEGNQISEAGLTDEFIIIN